MATQPVTIVQEPLKDLLVWKSPARVFKKRDREFYTTIAAIIFLLAVIMLFLKEWMLIALIISFGFMAYVLSTVEPQEVEHKITTKGVVTGEKRYEWQYLISYWFSKKWGNQILNIQTRLGFPPRLIMLLGKTEKATLQKILDKYIVMEKPQKSWIDKSGEWLAEKFPLESE